MTGHSPQPDVIDSVPNFRRRGRLVNWSSFSPGCIDPICIVLWAQDPAACVSWEQAGYSYEIGRHGDHYHPEKWYGHPLKDGDVICLNPTDQHESLWHVSNGQETPQQLWERGFIPIAIVDRSEPFDHLHWVVYRQLYPQSTEEVLGQ